MNVHQEKMPEELKTLLEQVSPFAKRYAEFRAKGLKQADAAVKAGSSANGRSAQSRVGWNTEQIKGIKEYIEWLIYSRAKASVVDDHEIIQKLRKVYDEAMMAGKFNDANKALEHMANMIGAFDKNKPSKAQQDIKSSKTEKIKENTKAFTEDLEGQEEDVRLRKLKRMLDDVNKSSN